jgi:Uncharacterized protein conserved in bacteria
MQRLQRLLSGAPVLAAALLLVCGVSRADPIAVDSRPVPLDAAQPERTEVGSLVYRGGLALSSKDPRFGGLSGLLVSADGKRFVAISDVGFWMTGALRRDSHGNLAGIADVALQPLLDAAGRPFRSKYHADAESLTAAPGGGFLVGFEGKHRIVRYRRVGGPGATIAGPADLARAPSNGGLETLTTLADGRVLAITETDEVDGGVRGWIGPAPWRAFVWPSDEGFRPTDAATLPDGDVLVLERRFPFLAARIRRVDAARLGTATLAPKEIARFEGSLTFDNMEAIDARRGPGGETLVYLLSDDNQSFLQRTLLLMFELQPPS